MDANVIKIKREREPYRKIERKDCPFYGFGRWPGLLNDTGGNQCALREGNSPCQMEIDELVPDWDSCGLNTKDRRKELEKIADSTQVMATEFYPGGEWAGIILREWMAYIESRKERKS